jgi:hypothetical protein
LHPVPDVYHGKGAVMTVFGEFHSLLFTDEEESPAVDSKFDIKIATARQRTPHLSSLTSVVQL